MATDMTDEEQIAWHMQEVEAIRRRVKIKGIQDAIAEKKAELNALEAQLETLLPGGVTSRQTGHDLHAAALAQAASDVPTVTPQETVSAAYPKQEVQRSDSGDDAGSQQSRGLGDQANEASFTSRAARSEYDDEEIRVSHNAFTPDTETQRTSSDPTESRAGSSTHFQRSTRNSLRQAGISIESLGEPKLLLEQLRDKKGSICQEIDGAFVDISCHLCGANRVKQPSSAYSDPRFTLSGLRSHYSSSHKVALDQSAVYTICTKTQLTEQDIVDILNDRKPANEKLRDRVQPKKDRSKAGEPTGGAVSTSEPSVLRTWNDSPDPLALTGSSSLPSDVSGILSNDSTVPSSTQARPLKRKGRSEDLAKDKENAPSATQRRARLSDISGATDTSSPTMQDLYCERNGAGEFRGQGSSQGRKKKTMYEVFGELGANSLAC